MGARSTPRRRDGVDVALVTVLRLAADLTRPIESAAEQLLEEPPRGQHLRRARARVAAALAAHPSRVGERALGILDTAIARSAVLPDQPTGTTAGPDHVPGASDVVHA